MTDFLLELLSEEIPARMQEKACADLASLFAEKLEGFNLKAKSIETFATPRRLALIARGLPDQTAPISIETKGPKIGAPAQAIEGFLRRYQLNLADLEQRDGVYFAVRSTKSQPTAEILGDVTQRLILDFPWPKSMRWGAASASTASLRWVRPLQGIVALFGDAVVPCEVDGIASGAVTRGHRFHHPGPITIGSAQDYAGKLRACHVILDPAERRGIIEGGARAAAAAEGLSVIPDAGLVAENAGLTEWPVPLLGAFDPAFLEVPREVIQLTMRTNQKYFACVDGDGKLAPNFICTANIVAADGGAAIVAGNRKVLAARLADAKFFWEQDLKVPLARQAEKLGQIVFHEKLGTVADKVERVARLARWLVESDVVTPAKAGVSGGHAQPAEMPASAGMTTKEHLADMAEQAARLAKADLVTGMVGEFPELQGVMGGYYAAAEGLPREVADAIRDHYKPVGQSDDVPTAPVTVAVSLADKLDSLQQFFAIGETPTGSKDPFALRRSALGIIRLLTSNGLRFRVPADLLDFFADRLKVQQREAGVRHDLIDAVFALGGEDDLVRLLARVRALQAFVASEDGANLLAGYKRAANILRKEGWEDGAYAPSVTPAKAGVHREGHAEREMDPSVRRDDGGSVAGALPYTPEPAESALISALDRAEAAAAEAVKDEKFEAAMAALATLRQPIDQFFDSVTVNDVDPAKREARLALLARIRRAVHQVADFSKIEG